MPPLRAMGIDSLVIGAVEAASKPGNVDAPIGKPSCRCGVMHVVVARSKVAVASEALMHEYNRYGVLHGLLCAGLIIGGCVDKGSHMR